MMDVSVREYVGPQAMDVLAHQWHQLNSEDDLATPFQSPQWLTAWARQLPHTSTPVILAATSPSGRILAALAMARQDGGPRSRFVPLSAPHTECVRLVGPHAEDPAIARAFVFHLLLIAEAADADVVMTDVPATSALGQCLNQLCEDHGWQSTSAASASIPLPVHYDTLARSTQRQHTRRRHTWTRLAASRTVTYTRTRHTQDLLDAFGVLCHLHQRRSRPQDALPAPAIAADAHHWRPVLTHLGAAHAAIATLAVDDTVIAGQMILTRQPRCYSRIPATDPAYGHLAAGHALLRYLIADLAQEGFHTLELGRTTGHHTTFERQYGPRRTPTLTALSTSRQTAA
ncbi:GNAT family N-acetyltransferase [Streptomyces sp. NPDC050535]|uniref:GNAT family N-acetyltransferase n=1 Tax=Streptomyces sp. NPDC050535 TaxID=3365626 RepID=UPI0037BA05D2